MSSPKYHRIRRSVCLFVALGTAVTLITACTGTASRQGALAADQQILASCDPAAPPASLVEIDGTGSSASEAVVAERMAAIEQVVRRTAICSGHLRVLVFSASSAATTVLFDGALRMGGATDNARLKRIPEAVAGITEKVRAGYGPAVAALPKGGSDITAQLRLAAEWIGQLGGSYRLNLVVLTDGFQNIGVDLAARPLGTQEATALADQAVVPKLTGASVVVAGLGRIAEGAPSSVMVEGLVAYYERLCQRADATTCSAVTDYTAEGR